MDWQGIQRLGAGNQCLYCPFWTRGDLDYGIFMMHPVAPDWPMSKIWRQAPLVHQFSKLLIYREKEWGY